MGYYQERASFAAEPVLLLPPQHPGQPGRETMTDPSFNAPAYFTQGASSTWSQAHPSPPVRPTISRKRSRDDAASNLEEDYSTPITPMATVSEDDWEYGEGMTLIRPNGFIIDASSQTGTWAEEKVEEEQQQAQAELANNRPELPRHKSQRLDSSATSMAEENSLPTGPTVASSPSKMPNEPAVDMFTIHLGIGWSRLSDAEGVLAAARGWAKFIENHYPVSNVRVRLQSKGLASYLAEANEGFFLFKEDLKAGCLVATSLDQTFENLRSVPPIMDGQEMHLSTMESQPLPQETHMQNNANMTAQAGPTHNPFHTMNGSHSGMDMDMS